MGDCKFGESNHYGPCCFTHAEDRPLLECIRALEAALEAARRASGINRDAWKGEEKRAMEAVLRAEAAEDRAKALESRPPVQFCGDKPVHAAHLWDDGDTSPMFVCFGYTLSPLAPAGANVGEAVKETVVSQARNGPKGREGSIPSPDTKPAEACPDRCPNDLDHGDFECDCPAPPRRPKR